MRAAAEVMPELGLEAPRRAIARMGALGGRRACFAPQKLIVVTDRIQAPVQ